MRVGFIGLGTMGAGMASNLAKAGYELVVHDARKEAAESFLIIEPCGQNLQKN